MLIINKTLILLALASLSFSTCAHDLEGEWVVDQEKTMYFNMHNIKFSSLRMALLSCSINNSSLFFSKNNARFTMQDHNCEHDGKKGLIKGTVDDFTFSVIFQNERQSAIKIKSKTNDEYVEVINWIDSETFWMDQGDDDVSRYFYRRKITKN